MTAHTTAPGCCNTCRTRLGLTALVTLVGAVLDDGHTVIRYGVDHRGPEVQVHGVDAFTVAARLNARITDYDNGDPCDRATIEWAEATAMIVGTAPKRLPLSAVPDTLRAVTV